MELHHSSPTWAQWPCVANSTWQRSGRFQQYQYVQLFICMRTLIIPALDFLTWTRGSRDDFDRMANITQDSGWSWDAMLPYILKVNQDYIKSAIDTYTNHRWKILYLLLTTIIRLDSLSPVFMGSMAPYLPPYLDFHPLSILASWQQLPKILWSFRSTWT